MHPSTASPFTGAMLIGAAVTFWTAWLLMPGVGVTDAAAILVLVASQPQAVLASSLLQLASAVMLGLAIPGLALSFAPRAGRLGQWAVGLLAVGACGDAADAIYHQLAYEMVMPGVDRAAMLPVMQRMQSTDLLFLMPLILAFFAGSIALSVTAWRMNLVPAWNPLLYALMGLVIAVAAGTGLPGRWAGLIALGLLSLSLGGVGLAMVKAAGVRSPGPVTHSA